MGEHDQTMLHDEDTHEHIHDDGRTLSYIEFGAGAGAGADHDAYRNPDAYADKSAFRFCNDKLIPDTVRVRLRPFTVTKWESVYSTVFGSGTHPDNWFCPSCDPGIPASFEPVIDDLYRVIGHLGWISGTEVCVPKATVAWDSPVAHIFEERRLGEDRQRSLSLHDRDPFPRFPARRAAPEPDSPFWAAVRRGQLKDASDEQRHQNNINYFLAGDGTAVVGRDFVHDHLASQNFEPFLPGGYRCMALVNPDGYLQAVLGVEKIHHESRREAFARIAFEVIDIALTIWMIIDIATISVGLLRLGVMLASRAEIRAIEMAANQAAKAALKIAEAEARRALRVGAMAGPKAVAKDAFWRAATAMPRQFSKAEAEQWTARIARRMKELGIPEKNIGCKVKKYAPGKPNKIIRTTNLAGDSGEAFNPVGTERGSRLRTFADESGVEEGGISVHGSVFERWQGFDLWNDPTTRIEDRIDAIIAHEWMEFNELSHWETVELIEQSTLRISKRAKELLQFMKTQGKPLKALTEFPRP